MSTPAEPRTAITPRREEDFPEWYQQVIRAAELAENSDVRGCMVIRPWGYGIWENMQRQLDAHVQGHRPQERLFPALHSARAISRRRPSTSKALPRNARSSRITGSKSMPRANCVPRRRPADRTAGRAADLARRSSARPTPSGCSATAICQSSSTNGATSSAGKCGRGFSCARRSFSGRKATPRTRPKRKRAKKRNRCSASTKPSRAIISPFRSSPAKKRRRTFPRRRADALHRGDGAGSQGDPGRHVAFPRAKFRARQRDPIPDARRQTGVRLDDELGHEHAADRHAYHGARR